MHPLHPFLSLSLPSLSDLKGRHRDIRGKPCQLPHLPTYPGFTPSNYESSTPHFQQLRLCPRLSKQGINLPFHYFVNKSLRRLWINSSQWPSLGILAPADPSPFSSAVLHVRWLKRDRENSSNLRKQDWLTAQPEGSGETDS